MTSGARCRAPLRPYDTETEFPSGPPVSSVSCGRKGARQLEGDSADAGVQCGDALSNGECAYTRLVDALSKEGRERAKLAEAPASWGRVHAQLADGRSSEGREGPQWGRARTREALAGP